MMTAVGLTRWRVVDESTGRVTDVEVSRKPKRGRKPTVKGMHKRVTRNVRHPAPQHSVRMMFGGVETTLLAARPVPPMFAQRVARRQLLLRKRGHPLSSESGPLSGQAAHWYAEVIQCVPHSGQLVARQIARLCGDDSRVTMPLRSLADAVGHRNSAGRTRAYSERGTQCLVAAGWLRTEVTGAGQTQVTTFYLQAGERAVEWFPDDDEVWEEARL